MRNQSTLSTQAVNARYYMSLKFGVLRSVIIGIFTSWLITSCSPVKNLGPNAYLLNKNTIVSNNKEINQGAKAILKQKPNRKIIGLFRFHLGVYNLANRGKPTRFKQWVKKTIGEEPVVLDNNATIKSRNQVEQYLQNEGFFNATVSDSTIYKHRKRANVIYTIETGDPYTLRNVDYVIEDPVIEQLVLADTASSQLKPGNNFKTSEFTADRERVTKLLRNIGYYEFNQLYISFDVDSSLKSNQADVKYIISNPVSTTDSPSSGSHKVFRINNVFVQTDYDPLAKTLATPTDTIIHKNYYFLSKTKKLKYKKEAFLPLLFFEHGGLYKMVNGDLTYRGLASLSLFKFINIRFEEAINDTLKGNWLNTHILLSPSPKQDYKFEIEGTHNGGNFGIGGNFTYRNKNTFRGAELMELKLKIKTESIPDFADETSSSSESIPLNTLELGPEINIRVPRFLWPIRKSNKNRSSNPASLFNISYNYQQRPEFKRNFLLLSSGIEFRESLSKRHFVYPAEINYSIFDLSSAFAEKLENTPDEKLKNYYKKYLITNGRYTFVFNTQQQNSLRNFLYLRFSFEIAGNSLRLIHKFTKSNYSDDTQFEIFNTQYSQYIRPDVDFRYYQIFSENSSLVYRVVGGIGISYLNSENIPYEKTFFAGGANDLRAFSARTVGPGSYQPDINIEQLGDIKINANVEYRSDIFKILEGAVFIDAGNIWLRKENINQPGAKFESKEFLSQVAIGGGLGLRFDFTFFILRIDAGVPFKDPSLEKGDRWVLNRVSARSVKYNFGIGYPF